MQLYQNSLSHFSRSAPTKLWFVLKAKNINFNQLPPITEGTLATRFWTAWAILTWVKCTPVSSATSVYDDLMCNNH